MPRLRTLTPEQEEICNQKTVKLVRCLRKDVVEDDEVMAGLQGLVDLDECSVCHGYDNNCTDYMPTVSTKELEDCFWRKTTKPGSVYDCRDCVKTSEETTRCSYYFPNIIKLLLE